MLLQPVPTQVRGVPRLPRLREVHAAARTGSWARTALVSHRVSPFARRGPHAPLRQRARLCPDNVLPYGLPRPCRKTCLSCDKALEHARARLTHLKPKLPARKLPAAPPSLLSTPASHATAKSKFVSDDSRASIERWISDSIVPGPAVFSAPACFFLIGHLICFLNLFLRTVRNCINSFICYVCVGIATGIRGVSLPEESRAAMRAAARPGESPTSTVWGDEWGEEQGNQMRQHMLAASMGERHLSA